MEQCKEQLIGFRVGGKGEFVDKICEKLTMGITELEEAIDHIRFGPTDELLKKEINTYTSVFPEGYNEAIKGEDWEKLKREFSVNLLSRAPAAYLAFRKAVSANQSQCSPKMSKEVEHIVQKSGPVDLAILSCLHHHCQKQNGDAVAPLPRASFEQRCIARGVDMELIPKFVLDTLDD